MDREQAMTPTEALLWLAGLEKPCKECTAKDGVPCNCLACHGAGKVPVLLGLREPCPCLLYLTFQGYHELCSACEARIGYGIIPTERIHQSDCLCQGRNWVPEQGRQAIQDAMVKDGWYYTIEQRIAGRIVDFWKDIPESPNRHRCRVRGTDANDWLAAVKAMEAAGYV